MKPHLAIPLSKIGSKIHVTFGKTMENTPNSFHLDSILSEWTSSFLQECSLNSPEDLEKVSGYLNIIKEQNIFRAEGVLEFEPQLECVRSLTLYREKLKVELNGFFVPYNSQKYLQSGLSKLSQQQNSDEIELTESDLESYSFKGNAIQLDEFLLDSMFCALPELPLCREDCKGLCPECGIDLNEKDLQGNYQILEHKKSCFHYKPLKS
ncbi:YceD family protein [Silvanigrella aquatica]|uniref:DUF177 domain-containing protein n=1 Tax=Silvanigrella aquatica TaxID=1915309 RepID=A0A1L4D0Q0_9BACT|nr:DUF177 domain-containing protein [Silvanigrella aquatica]APJ03764.1 hypothetical protein AXG55_07535 [Silvanigrella aquatica]